MRDRIPTQVLENGALRYGVYDEAGNFLRHEYLALDDAPTDTGTDLSKATLLQDSTEVSLFGAAADRTVDDAFKGLAGQLKLIMGDMASITVTLKDSAGTAIPGVLVQGILSDSGQAVYSNDSGVAAGYISEGTQVVKVTGYADIVDYSETLSVTKGTTITKTITLTTRNFLKITSSQSVKFSGNVETVDVTVVGGGGGGGLADSDDWEDTTGGGGGGGGYAIEQLGIQIQPETKYPLVVGAGGTGNGNAGGDGGTSSAFGYSAAGGKCGGTRAGGAVIGGSGGNGNGSGGTGGAHYRGVEPGTTNVYTMLQTLPTAGSAGTQYMYTSFTEKTLCGGGGGGGLCSDGTVASGGSPAGGAGGRGEAGSVIHAKAGNDYLGGGGGGGGSELEHDDDRTYIEAKNAKGGSGGIGIRMHLKSAA